MESIMKKELQDFFADMKTSVKILGPEENRRLKVSVKTIYLKDDWDFELPFKENTYGELIDLFYKEAKAYDPRRETIKYNEKRGFVSEGPDNIKHDFDWRKNYLTILAEKLNGAFSMQKDLHILCEDLADSLKFKKSEGILPFETSKVVYGQDPVKDMPYAGYQIASNDPDLFFKRACLIDFLDNAEFKKYNYLSEVRKDYKDACCSIYLNVYPDYEVSLEVSLANAFKDKSGQDPYSKLILTPREQGTVLRVINEDLIRKGTTLENQLSDAVLNSLPPAIKRICHFESSDRIAYALMNDYQESFIYYLSENQIGVGEDLDFYDLLSIKDPQKEKEILPALHEYISSSYEDKTKAFSVFLIKVEKGQPVDYKYLELNSYSVKKQADNAIKSLNRKILREKTKQTKKTAKGQG